MSTFPNIPPPPPREPRPGSRRLWIKIAAPIALVALIVLGTCGRSFYRNYRIARSAVEHFHQRLDAGDFDSIYEDATDSFRAAASHSDELKVFATVHQKLGNSGAMTQIGFHVNWQNGYLVASQVFTTQFAQGPVQEEFIWIIQNGRPRLQTYHIDAPQLH